MIRERATGALPPECACAGGGAFGDSPVLAESRVVHRTTRTLDRTYALSDLALAADATRLDAVLYGAAVDRFAREIDAAETRHGVQILCRDGRRGAPLPAADPAAPPRKRADAAAGA